MASHNIGLTINSMKKQANTTKNMVTTVQKLVAGR